MCGIVISKNPNDIEKIKHRGIFINKIKIEDYWLQHVSLPIQTDENTYFQPIETRDYYILYNGEIFNYDIKSLDSDLDLIRLYFEDIKIKNLFPHIYNFDGFFSFVIYDKNTNDIYMFTDLLGKKQLYYKLNNNGISIASEIRALADADKINSLDLSEYLDMVFYSSVIKNGYYFSDDRTPFVNIKRVLPGKLYHYRHKENLVTIDYMVDPYVFLRDEFKTNKHLYELIEESVYNRVVTIKNYPTAILYSGGIDSSIILYHLSKLAKDIKVITIENEEDLQYAKIGLEAFNIKSDIIYLKEDFLDYNKAIIANELPQDLGSVYPNYKMFEAIKSNFPDIRVVFTGDGADELFCGYRRNEFYRAQESDIFQELTFYHLPRLDKLSMYFTLELRNPFLSNDVISYALNSLYSDLRFKKILKNTYKNIIPDEILNRKKTPLKNSTIKRLSSQQELISHRNDIYEIWLNNLKYYF